MKELELKLTYRELAYNELAQDDKQLFERAKEAMKKAYAPYSKFYVGAAVLLENGEIFAASNQENAAYPSGLCAERNVLFYAGAQQPHQKILKLAVTVDSATKDSTKIYPPCGACRQVMAEVQTRQSSPLTVMFEGGNDKVLITESVDMLLPFIFSF